MLETCNKKEKYILYHSTDVKEGFKLRTFSFAEVT